MITALNSIKPGKKELSNIPADGKWLWRFDTRSDAERLQRWAQTKKFYATLPHKIDASVEEYLAAIDAEQQEWEFWEELDGETPLGGAMGLSSNLIKDNTHKRDGH